MLLLQASETSEEDRAIPFLEARQAHLAQCFRRHSNSKQVKEHNLHGNLVLFLSDLVHKVYISN